MSIAVYSIYIDNNHNYYYLPHSLTMGYDPIMLLHMLRCCTDMFAGRMIHVVCMDGVSHEIARILRGMRTIAKHFHVCHN